jgi:transporter family-2 protein
MTLIAFVLALLAVAVGAFLPVQIALNAQLARNLQSAIAANVFSFGMGLLALVLLSVVVFRDFPSWSVIRQQPPHLLVVGGLLGAAFLTTTIFLTPKLGSAAVLCFVMAGQLSAAMLIDHFGLIGLAERHVSTGRLFGAVMVLAGAVMVRLL